MKENIFRTIAFCIISVFCYPNNSYSQSNIQEQYQLFFDKSSNWEDYKVIKLNRLNEFWSIVTDTLNDKQQRINSSAQEIIDLNTKLRETNTQLATTEDSLNLSQKLNDSILFFGLQIDKTTYNIFVWSIIIVLAIGIGSFYVMFKQSNLITKKTKENLQEIESEYNEHKAKAMQSQVKLKRELQTALNQLNERRS